MSNVPGLSPITPDLEEVRRSEEDGAFEEGEAATPEEEGDDVDETARRTVEEGRRVFDP